MVRIHCAMIAAAAALGLAATPGRTQPSAPTMRIVHVSAAVRDIDRALQTLAGVLGVSPARVISLNVDTPDGRKLPMKVANTQLTNFLIEFDQAVGVEGPTQDFIERNGQGIQHLGVSVSGPLDAPMNALEQHGGRWTLGLTRNGWVFLDLMQTLGMTIDLTNLPVPAPATTADVLAGGLAKYPVAHVTFLSTHAD